MIVHFGSRPMVMRYHKDSLVIDVKYPILNSLHDYNIALEHHPYNTDVLCCRALLSSSTEPRYRQGVGFS